MRATGPLVIAGLVFAVTAGRAIPGLGQPASAPPPTAAVTGAPPPVQPFVRNWTRFEAWRYFEPPAPSPTFTPGDPTTAHVANRLLAGARLRRGVLDSTIALQYVQFGGLPANASGPGALGTGALYFDHSGRRSSSRLYVKTANVAFRRLGGQLDVQIGRMPYTSGAERPSNVPKIEAVKRQRIDSRLVGEFEWALYQRSFDGVRVDWAGRDIRLTGTAFQPTQGGYEEAAGVSMSDVRVFSGVMTTAPGRIVPGSELQLFAHHYRDKRPVTARPDNTGLRATAADIEITTIGAHLVGTRPGLFPTLQRADVVCAFKGAGIRLLLQTDRTFNLLEGAGLVSVEPFLEALTHSRDVGGAMSQEG